jgi:DEAD/DEAH box helicase domain-containing protein
MGVRHSRRGRSIVDIDRFIEHLRELPDYLGQIVHVERIPPRAARWADVAQPLPERLREVLAAQGVERFYTHQAQAIDAAHRGEHVIVATGTASGKTLCYNVPVLTALLEDPLSRALYLYPTKALAQDQLRVVQGLTEPLRRVRAMTYDGDTPQGSRARVRRMASIVLSNPDMLHVGILPNHQTWAPFFRHLRYVVVDEAHVYRGVFGSHLANVLRRLRRVCALHGAQPQFILSSATIGNPATHAARLIGEEATVVEEDGAPSGPRWFVLWNPPMLDTARGRRVSINTEATRLLTEMVKATLRNITFTRARKVAELILLYARDTLREWPALAEGITAYRGGYTPRERREIERRLFAGELLAVTATNALELGIDVGELNATILVGYPGSIASTWQQAGRAGRGRKAALSVLIGQDDPLDQYLMRHPEALFGRPHEQALVDAGNPYVLRGHLACAADEYPLTPADEALFGPGYARAVTDLVGEGALELREGRWFYVGEEYPSRRVSIRSTSSDRYLLLDEGNNHEVLEEVDAATAFIRIYPGAIHLHRAESYLITRLDIPRRLAFARAVDADYYTQPREVNEVHIIRSLDARPMGAVAPFFGEVRVTQQVTGFRRRRQYTEQVIDEQPLDLPPYSYETQALWFEVPEAVQRAVVQEGLDFGGGLHAVEHAMIGVLPLLAMCDRGDIGGLSTPAHPDTDRPQIFVYDGYPGGVGLTRRGFEAIGALWRRTLEVVGECPCEAGCPSCIQSPNCGSNNEPLDKAAAVLILQGLLAAVGDAA